MVNSATLIGNLGKDPDSKFTQSGKQVVTFSMATTEKYKGENHTTWHNIVVWGKLAEICEQYLSKGSKIYICGKIQNRSYQDKDGNTKYISEIIAYEMTMLDSKPKDEQPASREPVFQEPGDDVPW